MRKPDFVIGRPEDPYLRRWWIIPRNRFFNIYLHQILKSDDDRALHDHPWWNVSIILRGGYFEVMPTGIKKRYPGAIIVRRARAAHRLELGRDYAKGYWDSNPAEIGHTMGGNVWVVPLKLCWSLFITGPKVREWGFLCPQGWRHWRDFIGVKDGEARGDEVGPGCEG